MTIDEPQDEGTAEAVEDLEAPAEAQGDVAGGAPAKGCGKPSMICAVPTCVQTMSVCRDAPVTSNIVDYEQ